MMEENEIKMVIRNGVYANNGDVAVKISKLGYCYINKEGGSADNDICISPAAIATIAELAKRNAEEYNAKHKA